MVANRRLARSIADAAWGELHRQLAYKAGWYDTELAVAPRWFPSSKTCSACGRRNETLTLADRTFRCDPDHGGCGLVIDRDRNAATNLAAGAEAEHLGSPGPGPPSRRPGHQRLWRDQRWPPHPRWWNWARNPSPRRKEAGTAHGRQRRGVNGRPRRALASSRTGGSTGFKVRNHASE